MKRLNYKAFAVFAGGGYYPERRAAQVSCSPRLPEGGLRRSEEQTRLTDSIGEVNP